MINPEHFLPALLAQNTAVPDPRVHPLLPQVNAPRRGGYRPTHMTCLLLSKQELGFKGTNTSIPHSNLGEKVFPLYKWEDWAPEKLTHVHRSHSKDMAGLGWGFRATPLLCYSVRLGLERMWHWFQGDSTVGSRELVFVFLHNYKLSQYSIPSTKYHRTRHNRTEWN